MVVGIIGMIFSALIAFFGFKIINNYIENNIYKEINEYENIHGEADLSIHKTISYKRGKKEKYFETLLINICIAIFLPFALFFIIKVIKYFRYI